MMPNSSGTERSVRGDSPVCPATKAFHRQRVARAFETGGSRLPAALLSLFFALAALTPIHALALRLTNSQEAGSDPPNASLPTGRITYTRTLTGSSPEYLSVSVNGDGSGSYVGRRLDEPAHPRALRLSPVTTQRLFALVAQLNNLRSIDLDSHKKVANLGLKTLTYESGSEKNQVEFNFTQQRAGRELTDLFEGVANVEEQVDLLEYAIKYDPLGLPQQLLAIQIALNHNELVDPELMIPSLHEITSNPRFMHVAQVRAQDILRTVSPGQ